MANIGLLFAALGYDVRIYGFGEDEQTGSYKGITFQRWKEMYGSGFSVASRRDAYKEEMIRAAVEAVPPDMIVSALSNCRAQRFLLSCAAKRGLPMFQSVCEWYDRNAFVGLSGLPKLINDRYSMYVQFPRVGNIIAISTLLDRYYASRGCRTVVIPTMVDMQEYGELSHPAHDRLRIAYAGAPARKDYILNAIRALALLQDEELRGIEMHLYGPTPEQLRELGMPEELLERCGDSLVCHGRIPYAQVKQRIAEADFTVLLRPDRRYANAGFPTKVGESMACGTPVICNLTSDLGLYVRDGETGLVAADESAEACAESFRRALCMTADERLTMRQAVRKEAENAFDYRNYVGHLRRFLER